MNRHPEMPRVIALLLIACAIVGILVAAGCTSLSGPKLADEGIKNRAVELTSVPFYPQDDDQCAVAAIAAVIGAQKVAVNLNELKQAFAKAAPDDPMSAEALSAARSSGLVPYLLHSPHPEADVVREVQAGNPVAVLLSSSLLFGARWHFAVIVGVDPKNDKVVLRSCLNARETTSFGDFLSNWSGSNNWAMVLLPADKLPATIDAQSAIAAIRPLEKNNQIELAERAYSAITERWPDNVLAWKSLADVRYQQKNLRGSIDAWVVALQLAPDDNVSRNNLAYVLLDRQCAEQAEDLINKAIASETDPAQLETFKSTRYWVLKHEGPSVVCPGLENLPQ